MEQDIYKPAGNTITGGDSIRTVDDLPEHLVRHLLVAPDDVHYSGAVLQPLPVSLNLLQGGRSADGAALHNRSLYLRSGALQRPG